MSVTFMAKYCQDQAGSSCHIHLSLWNGKENTFPVDLKEGPIAYSKVFRRFLGGWIAGMQEMMVFYVSNINTS